MTDARDNFDGLLNMANVEAWLGANVPQLGSGPLEAQMLQGGTANLVFRISRGGRSLALRRPPKFPRPDSERVIEREARVLKALNGSDVPRPEFFGFCADPAVAGAKFYVMDFIEGFLPVRIDTLPAAFADRSSKVYHDLAFALLSGSVKLHQVDHVQVGLADFGKTENFLERQVDRWLGQLESYKTADGYEGRVIPGMAYVADWLRANRPQSRYFGIIHGDYSFANSMYFNEPPPRLAAMIDWELATIGDTLLDLGSVLYGFRGRHDKTPAVGFFGPEYFPDRETLAEYYADETGRSIEHLDYYIVLAIFKLAAIMEGQVARGLAGKQDSSRVQSNIDFVNRITAKAEALARG